MGWDMVVTKNVKVAGIWGRVDLFDLFDLCDFGTVRLVLPK